MHWGLLDLRIDRQSRCFIDILLARAWILQHLHSHFFSWFRRSLGCGIRLYWKCNHFGRTFPSPPRMNNQGVNVRRKSLSATALFLSHLENWSTTAGDVLCRENRWRSYICRRSSLYNTAPIQKATWLRSLITDLSPGDPVSVFLVIAPMASVPQMVAQGSLEL